MNLLDRRAPVAFGDAGDAEAVIREAKRRQRRRRAAVALTACLVVASTVTVAIVLSGGGAGARVGSATHLPDGPSVNVRAFKGQGLLAFVSRGSLWVLDGRTGTFREVTDDHPLDPAFSPDGRWLAYLTAAPSPGPGQLWLARSDGSDPQRVPGFAAARDLTWSPTNDQLAVLDAGKPGIWLVSPGQAPRVLAGTSHAANFVWSPSGRAIAFAGYYQYGDLEAVPTSGGPPVLWQREHNNRAYPLAFNPTVPAAWLPGGEGMLYWVDPDDSASLQADGSALYLVHSPGSPAHLLGNTLVNSSAIAVSSDGAIAIDSTTSAGRYQWDGKAVQLCSAQTATCTAVAVPKSDVSIDPSWSPRGDKLVFAVGPSYGDAAFPQSSVEAWYSALSLWQLEGSQRKPFAVRGTSGAADVLWSASGKSLLFEAQDRLWLKVGGSARVVAVASPLFGMTWPNFYAQVDWTSQFAWSPT